MKALTVCQPYAHLIARGEKRVENRKYNPAYAAYRGPLLIHAGKSREWLSLDPDSPDPPADAYYDIPLRDMAFGAIVAHVNVVETFSIAEIRDPNTDLGRYFWLRDHEHAEGPLCLVLADLWVPEKPIAYRGAQMLFEVEGVTICARGSRNNRAGQAAWHKVPQCRVCGCVDEYGCGAGCWWVERDLCSECQPFAKSQGHEAARAG